MLSSSSLLSPQNYFQQDRSVLGELPMNLPFWSVPSLCNIPLLLLSRDARRCHLWPTGHMLSHRSAVRHSPVVWHAVAVFFCFENFFSNGSSLLVPHSVCVPRLT